MLRPDQKFAMAMDLTKIKESRKKLTINSPADIFDTMRQLVREGNSGTGEKVEKLGTKEIDGRTAVGFQLHNVMGDMTLWADPATACAALATPSRTGCPLLRGSRR